MRRFLRRETIFSLLFIAMRPDQHAYFMQMARLVAERSTCARRAVGCVLVDERNHVLATGYNGVPSGWPHCNEGNACEGAGAKSTTRLEACRSIHAEQNALIQCRDAFAIRAAYCTASPCVHCAKMLLNTSCELIVYGMIYDPEALALWGRSGRGACLK